MLEIHDEFDPPFEALEPADCRGPILFNSPHSGRVYPRGFLLASRLDLATLRRSEDSFVDELIAGVVARGHPLVRAHLDRSGPDSGFVDGDQRFRLESGGRAGTNPAPRECAGEFIDSEISGGHSTDSGYAGRTGAGEFHADKAREGTAGVLAWNRSSDIFSFRSTDRSRHCKPCRWRCASSRFAPPAR